MNGFVDRINQPFLTLDFGQGKQAVSGGHLRQIRRAEAEVAWLREELARRPPAE